MAEGDWLGGPAAPALHGREQYGGCLVDQYDLKDCEHGLPEGKAVCVCVCVCA